jgi:hypothetical protein
VEAVVRLRAAICGTGHSARGRVWPKNDGFGTSDGEKQTFIGCDIGRLPMAARSVG